jgi:hypothetical protein
METIIRAFEAQIDSVQDGERSVVARINTDSIDRFNTVIDPLGCDTRGFNKTGSVLYEHGKSTERGTKPIGHGWAKVRQAERDMIGKTKFAKDDFSQSLFELARDGDIKSWSISALVRDASPPTKDEIARRPELAECEKIYRKWELTEYSLVSVAGNADCTSILVSRGLIAPPEGYIVPEPAKEEAKPELVIRTERYIDSDGSLWRIFEPNGQPIASFSDPELAEECLRMMAVRSTLNHQTTLLFTEMRALQEEHYREIKEYIDLYTTGRI